MSREARLLGYAAGCFVLAGALLWSMFARAHGYIYAGDSIVGQTLPSYMTLENNLAEIRFVPIDPIALPEVDERGNMVTTGLAEIAVLYDYDARHISVADLRSSRAVDPDHPLEVEVGSRCSVSVLAAIKRATASFTMLCMENDVLYRRVNP